MEKKKKTRIKIGHVQQKILLLLLGGLVLGLTRSPRQYYRVVRAIGAEWKEINRQTLNESIKRLYKSHLVIARENEDGTTTLELNKKGKVMALTFDADRMKVHPMKRWDNKWRIAIFDIPEYLKSKRDALRMHMKQIGFIEYQKSAFITAWECRNEFEFVVEFHDLRKFVRFIVAESIDNELHFKKLFYLK
ncbi:MAG: hypothetical protein A2928_01620 [Candidatus Taylorbacteria bacterium RIFCSPLOWO2_01_FULL_45_15b]|uniref:Transcriptional repressor PaaX-like central Cas2-like domain-containing protein n=1 Tax=Candidatus Taylorbacteria bacterium RIFCSPLOWO2_01_FULL_45_15b TaxID=1802319 RepID=A0A1G2N8Q7_9BACT|nr:MAG: hypothetical protein A2928_01620 [Candidatus Taylorbacteria bacterium RIFCSPLOWO2_01_FULL_45_15b]